MQRLSLFMLLLGACHLGDDGAIVPCEEQAAGCDLDGDGHHADVDCNDQDATIHPGADEICDSVDNDCDGSVDDADDNLADGLLRYEDADRDGYGSPDGELYLCDERPSHVKNNGDCDDEDDSIHPDAVESCDDVDSDCDGAEITDIVTLNGSSFGDLSDALANAEAGDTLYVCEGTWLETLTIEQDIELHGVGDPAAVIIQPPQGDPAVHIAAGNVVIQGLTINGGTGKLADTLGYTAGGGIALMAGSLVLRNSILSNHSADSGSALFVNEAADSVIIDDSLIELNDAADSCGAILSSNTPLTLTDTIVHKNHSASYCGAIGSIGSTIDVTGGSITDNTSVGPGAGLLLFGSDLTLTDVEISENYSENSGGGITLQAGDMVCEGSTVIHANRAEAYGAGLYLYDSQVEGCTVTDNTAMYGGGISAIASQDIQLQDMVIRGNTAVSEGGGIYADTDLYLDDVEIVDNIAGFGGGIFVQGSAQVSMAQGSIIQNEATADIGGIGGGIRMNESAEFSAILVNMGSGIEDNSPEDVAIQVSGVEYTFDSYGESSTFSCTVDSFPYCTD